MPQAERDLREEYVKMRLILLAAFAAVGLSGQVWADDPKKKAPADGAKTTKLVIKDMT